MSAMKRSFAELASASRFTLAMMSSAVISRKAAWSVGPRVDHMGAKKEKRAGLDDEARDAVVVSAAGIALVDEAMLDDAREEEGRRWGKTW